VLANSDQASSADDAWSLFANTLPGYFPLIWDVTSYLATQDPLTHQLGIMDAIRKSVAAAPLPYTITKPSGEVRHETKLPSQEVLGQFPLPPFRDTDLPGIYTLDLALDADAPAVRELFAVNVDPAEGDLAGLGHEQLTGLLDRVPFQCSAEILQVTGVVTGPRQGEIWKTVAAVLLAFLLEETLLSWRFGAYQ